jgi:hypothetical protein
VGPISVCPTFGPLDVRLLKGLLDTAGVNTNVGTTTLALKEVRAFWELDNASGDWKSVPWIAGLPQQDLDALELAGGRMLLMDGVRRCFAALLSHLLSLLACISASGTWQAIVGDVATLAERIAMPKSWPLAVMEGLFDDRACRFGAPVPLYWSNGARAHRLGRSRGP